MIHIWHNDGIVLVWEAVCMIWPCPEPSFLIAIYLFFEKVKERERENTSMGYWPIAKVDHSYIQNVIVNYFIIFIINFIIVQWFILPTMYAIYAAQLANGFIIPFSRVPFCIHIHFNIHLFNSKIAWYPCITKLPTEENHTEIFIFLTYCYQECYLNPKQAHWKLYWKMFSITIDFPS